MRRFLAGDWRTGIRPDEVVRAIEAFDGAPIHAVKVPTGGDEVVVMLSTTPATEDEALEYWSEDAG